jgi:hypothetical protein
VLADPSHADVSKLFDGYDPAEIDELPLKIALGTSRTVAIPPGSG